MSKLDFVSPRDHYPIEAQNSIGELWWQSTRRGESGLRPRIASWVQWNKEEGETFTTNEIRKALNANAEQFQRRQRELRNWGWAFDSYQDDPSLDVGEYRLRRKGWWPGSSDPKPKANEISAATRRSLFDRDGSRCVICGYAAGEFYEDGTPVHLTAGHIIASSHGGSSNLDNLQTECSRCNETVRADTGTAIDSAAAWESIKKLNKAEKVELYTWIQHRKRIRSKLDHAFDLYRSCTPAGKTEIEKSLKSFVNKIDR